MRLACVQSNVVFKEPFANAQIAARKLEHLKDMGVELAIFPEAFLTGYCVECQTDAEAIAIERDHPAVLAVQEAADGLEITTIIGFAEARDGLVYNTAALFEPGRPARFYAKTHLPELGLDNFVAAGDELQVFDTAIGRIGILICFDLRAPEAARVLALKGADIIALPTNWPQGAEIAAEYMAATRAAENRVFLAACNRVGTENGFTFIGMSRIISPTGKALAVAGTTEDVLVADIDVAEARVKRNVITPGKFETTVFQSRRPELYEQIVKVESLV